MNAEKIPTKHDTKAIMRNAWYLHRGAPEGLENSRRAFALALRQSWSDAQRAIQAMIPLAVREERIRKLHGDLVALPASRGICRNCLMVSLLSAGIKISTLRAVQLMPKLLTQGYSSVSECDRSLIGIVAGFTSESATRRSFAGTFGKMSEQTESKNLNVQPTLEIRPGYRFNVLVDQDIVFPSFMDP